MQYIEFLFYLASNHLSNDQELSQFKKFSLYWPKVTSAQLLHVWGMYIYYFEKIEDRLCLFKHLLAYTFENAFGKKPYSVAHTYVCTHECMHRTDSCVCELLLISKPTDGKIRDSIFTLDFCTFSPNKCLAWTCKLTFRFMQLKKSVIKVKARCMTALVLQHTSVLF